MIAHWGPTWSFGVKTSGTARNLKLSLKPECTVWALHDLLVVVLLLLLSHVSRCGPVGQAAETARPTNSVSEALHSLDSCSAPGARGCKTRKTFYTEVMNLFSSIPKRKGRVTIFSVVGVIVTD